MDSTLLAIFELGLFFVLLVLNLQLFKAVRFEQMFRKGKTTEIQLVYILTVIIFTHLISRALMNLVELTFNLQ
jgi:uncharacterized membrane protein YwzB